MAVSIDSMKMDNVTGGEVDIPEGKVEQVCRQWLVHEDGGLAYRLQSDEIQDHLKQNKVKSRLVRADLLQAQTMQQFEMLEKQVQHEHQQQVMDEQLAKEMQLKLIEEEQRQAIEKQRLAEQDERLAQKLADKERQKVLRRKLAKEQAQIEKIKRERLRLAADFDLPIDSIERVADDLNELDLSDFCMKPPGQLSGDQLNQFVADQDEELARFLQMYENQRKTAAAQDQQTMVESQDHEIARLLFEEEKAKVRRAKEKRLQKQMQKQRSSQASSLLPDDLVEEQIYANHSRIVQHQAESLYEDPNHLAIASTRSNSSQPDWYALESAQPEATQPESSPFYYGQQCPSSLNDYDSPHPPVDCGYTWFNEPPNDFDTLSEAPNTSTSNPLDLSTAQGHPEPDADNRSNDSLALNPINDQINLAFPPYDDDEPIVTFVNRSQPPLPIAFHNIAMDIDPTYNRHRKQQLPPHSDLETVSEIETPIESLSSDRSYQEPPEAEPTRIVSVQTESNKASPVEHGGIHFAELARVSPIHVSQTTEVSNNPDGRPTMVMPRQVAANVDEYIQFAMQQRQNAMLASGYSMPIHGQRRPHVSSSGSHKKIKSKERNKDMCRQQ
jgi:hypothetical protein